jgi:hypothetical protein
VLERLLCVLLGKGWEVLIRLDTHLSYGLAILLLGIDSEE